jgi:hypothetical protein
MLILGSTLRKLEAVLSGAITTSQPEVAVTFTDIRADGARGMQTYLVALNSTTPVTICPAPNSGITRIVDTINVYNKDTASITVQINYDESGTDYILCKRTLATLETLTYEDE